MRSGWTAIVGERCIHCHRPIQVTCRILVSRRRSFLNCPGAGRAHVTDTFVADGRDGDLFLCLYRSVITGELRSDLDRDVLVDVVYGPIFHRMLMEHAPLNDAFIEQVLRIALNGALVQE
jgi:hypothetical protein